MDDNTEGPPDKSDDPQKKDVTVWYEFSYYKYDKPTNRWAASNFEATDWELFLKYG